MWRRMHKAEGMSTMTIFVVISVCVPRDMESLHIHTPYLFTSAHKTKSAHTYTDIEHISDSASDACLFWTADALLPLLEVCVMETLNLKAYGKTKKMHWKAGHVQECTHCRRGERFSRWKLDVFRWQGQYVNPLWGAEILVSFNLRQGSQVSTQTTSSLRGCYSVWKVWTEMIRTGRTMPPPTLTISRMKKYLSGCEHTM